MAALTPLPVAEAREIGARYGLDVEGVREILAGSVNSNFELRIAGGGRAFLRIYEEQAAPSAAREAALLDHLSAGGVMTPRPLHLTASPEAGFVSEHAGKPVAVFPWIEGEILCQGRVTPARAHAVGAALARVHLAGAGFHGAQPSRFGTAALAARLEGLPPAALDGPLAAAVGRLGRELAALPEALPTRAPAIHGDLFRDNVLWTPVGSREADFRTGTASIAALLDFESASVGLCSFDLMVTMLAWCYGDTLDVALVSSMAAGYQEVRPFDAEDRAELFAQGRFAAVRFAVTRITDFELRPRGSGVYKDYRRFLGRLDALDALGERGLLAAVTGNVRTRK